MSLRSTTRHNYGSGLYIMANYDPPGSGADTIVSGCNPVPELVSASYTGGDFDKVDVTHLTSPGGAKEMIPGWGEGGQFELKFNYTGALFYLLSGLVPNLTLSTGINASPAFGRVRIEISDPGASLITARVMLSMPTREMGEDGHDTISVTASVMEGMPQMTFVA